jgi:RNA polymerase sigma-70 factor, ECF subfamily
MLRAVPDEIADSSTLVARVATGDAQAFDQLVARLHAPMLRLAVRITGDAGDGEDVLQTGLARLWTQAGRYDPDRGSVEGWFRRIVTNLCLDRRRSIRIVAPIDEAHDIATTAPDPFETAAANARARRVDNAMAQLNPRQRAAIAMFHGEGATMAEIAEALDTTPKAIEGLLARARKDLSVLLASDADELRRMP